MDLGSFNARDVTGPLRLVTRSRDIKVDQISNSADLETERGDIEITPGRTPLAPIEARSGSGKIELVLPDNAMFQLEATAQHGDAVNDFGPPITKESGARTATLRGKTGDGPTIKLTAQRGWVSIRKEGAVPSELLPDTPKGKAPKAPKTLHDLHDSEVKM
jgi:hypothetical protein